MRVVEDYPRTRMELERRFATDEACGEYLAQLRWPRQAVLPPLGAAVAVDPVPYAAMVKRVRSLRR